MKLFNSDTVQHAPLAVLVLRYKLIFSKNGVYGFIPKCFCLLKYAVYLNVNLFSGLPYVSHK